MKKRLIFLILLCSCNPRTLGPSYPLNNSYWQWQYAIVKKNNQKIVNNDYSFSKQLKFGDNDADTTIFFENRKLVLVYKTHWDLGECCRGTDDYIFKTSDNYSFRAIIKSKGTTSLTGVTLEMSNLMKGNYSDKIDTITHFYKAINKFSY